VTYEGVASCIMAGHITGVSNNMELHTTQPKYFAPTYIEVVNLTGFSENKRLTVYCGNRCLFPVELKRTSLQPVCQRTAHYLKQMRKHCNIFSKNKNTTEAL
jgi:hypothetical protein